MRVEGYIDNVHLHSSSSLRAQKRDELKTCILWVLCLVIVSDRDNPSPLHVDVRHSSNRTSTASSPPFACVDYVHRISLLFNVSSQQSGKGNCERLTILFALSSSHPSWSRHREAIWESHRPSITTISFDKYPGNGVEDGGQTLIILINISGGKFLNFSTVSLSSSAHQSRCCGGVMIVDMIRRCGSTRWSVRYLTWPLQDGSSSRHSLILTWKVCKMCISLAYKLFRYCGRATEKEEIGLTLGKQIARFSRIATSPSSCTHGSPSLIP